MVAKILTGKNYLPTTGTTTFKSDIHNRTIDLVPFSQFLFKYYENQVSETVKMKNFKYMEGTIEAIFHGMDIWDYDAEETLYHQN